MAQNFTQHRSCKPKIISFEIFWFGGPVWARGAPKCQNFKITIFQARALKISHNIDCVNQKSYLLKFFGLGAPFGRPGAPKCPNFENFILNARVFKISHKVDYVNQKPYQLKFFGLGAPLGLRGAP